MPMSGATLGPLLDTAATSSNAAAAGPSQANWLAVANAIVSAIQAAHVASTFICPTTGGPLTGTGSITGISSSSLGSSLASAFMTGSTAGTSSVQSLANDIASALVTTIQGSAVVPSLGLLAPTGSPTTSGGPITGVTTVTGLVGATIGDAIAAKVTAANAAAGAASTSTWEAIGSQIASHVMSNAQVLPGTLIAPSGGGPVTGQGAIT